MPHHRRFHGPVSRGCDHRDFGDQRKAVVQRSEHPRLSIVNLEQGGAVVHRLQRLSVQTLVECQTAEHAHSRADVVAQQRRRYYANDVVGRSIHWRSDVITTSTTKWTLSVK